MAAASSGSGGTSAPPLVFQKHPAVPTSNTPPIFEWATHGWYNLRLDALQASSTLNDAQAELLVKAFEARTVTLPCPECRAHYVQDWTESPFTLAHARSAPAAIAWVEDLKTKVDARVAAASSSSSSSSSAAAGGNAGIAGIAAPPAIKISGKAPAVQHSRTSQIRAAHHSAAVRTREASTAAASNAVSTHTAPATRAPATRAPVAAAPFVHRTGIGASLRARNAALAKRLVPSATAAHRTPTIAAVRAAAAKIPLRAATTAHGDAMQRNVAIASALQQTRANASGRRGCNCSRR